MKTEKYFSCLLWRDLYFIKFIQHVNFHKQLKSRHEMPFHFVVNRLGHSINGKFCDAAADISSVSFPANTRTDPHSSSRTGLSCSEDKIKGGITSSCKMYFCTSTTTTSVPRERTMHKMISAEYT